MNALWEGRFSQPLSDDLFGFNSSLPFDKRMYLQDIAGSRAHAEMLLKCGIISGEDLESILGGLDGIEKDIADGTLVIEGAEDIHSFIETELTARVGDAGKRLHTARSRNDQVALDLRLYLIGEKEKTLSLINELTDTLCALGEKYSDTVMPGYTHMQRAQPLSFGHHLAAYAEMLRRDAERLTDWQKRASVSPLGSCALAGTPFPIDRFMTGELLGLSRPCANSVDGVSDRDFVMELAAVNSIIMSHLSRLAEELVLWSSWEFKFIELSDSCTTGSSIMPQKKNPDMAELVRGKTGRVYGDLMALLTVMKGLPLAYNKDMQEDKESIFDSVDTVNACLFATGKMLSGMSVKAENMERAAAEGFINATDCADYLVNKGMPFRDAYKLTGVIVADCIKNKNTLSSLGIDELKAFSPLFDEDYYDAVCLKNCMLRRRSYGGTSPEAKK